jgi:hypothetical protein
MSAVAFSCDTNIAGDTNQPPARNKDSKNMFPDFLKLAKKLFIILNVSQLIRMLIVTL